MRSSTGDSQLHIRKPTGSDIPELVTLEDECFVSYYREHRFTKSHFEAYLRNERAIFFVAIQSCSPVGYIAGYVKTGRPLGSARIESIAVLPSARRRAVGGRLIQRFIDEAKCHDCKSVTLEVAEANEAAKRFFSHRGFTRHQPLPAYYGSQHDGIRMKLALG